MIPWHARPALLHLYCVELVSLAYILLAIHTIGDNKNVGEPIKEDFRTLLLNSHCVHASSSDRANKVTTLAARTARPAQLTFKLSLRQHAAANDTKHCNCRW